MFVQKQTKEPNKEPTAPTAKDGETPQQKPVFKDFASI